MGSRSSLDHRRRKRALEVAQRSGRISIGSTELRGPNGNGPRHGSRGRVPPRLQRPVRRPPQHWIGGWSRRVSRTDSSTSLPDRMIRWCLCTRSSPRTIISRGAPIDGQECWRQLSSGFPLPNRRGSGLPHLFEGENPPRNPGLSVASDTALMRLRGGTGLRRYLKTFDPTLSRSSLVNS